MPLAIWMTEVGGFIYDMSVFVHHLPTVHITPRHYTFLSPFVLCVLYTCGDELNLVSSSMAQHFSFETGSVTESEGHNWLDWSVSPGDAPASTSQEG